MNTFLRRLFLTVLAATLIGPMMNSAHARDIAEKPPLTVGGIKENLRIAAGERADSRLQEILANYVRNEDPESGLIVIGAAELHEILSARKFSRLLKEKLKLRVVLISTWGTTSVPAYDGLVIDESNKVIANFSMKKVSVPNIEKLWSATSRAFEKIKRFSSLDAWMDIILNQFERGTHGQIYLHSHRQAEILSHLYHDAADDISIFKIGSNRPNWVFLDSDSRIPLEDETIEDFGPHIPAFIREDLEKAIILHTNGRFYTYSGGRSCEDHLTSRKRR